MTGLMALGLAGAASGQNATARPLALDPTVSPEHAVSQPLYRRAPNNQLDPAVASDGTHSLVVWSDGRGDEGDIFAARASQDGLVLDPSGIAISTAARFQVDPAVAFGRGNFLVVWSDGRSGASDIFGARVSPAGTVLDPGGFPISTAAGSQVEPAVAFDGSNFLVGWQDPRSGPGDDIFGARVGPAGTVLDPGGFPISTAVDAQVEPAVAFDGSNFLVVWQDFGGGAGGTRVSPAGAVLDPDGIPISTGGGFQPALAFDGTNFLVVWWDLRSDGIGDIFATRVAPTGTVLDPSGVAVSSRPGFQAWPAVAFDGTNFLVAWTDERLGFGQTFATRVSGTGVVFDPAGVPISTAANAQHHPAVAFDGSNFLVAWEHHNDVDPDWDIAGARVSPAGAVLDPSGIPISTAADFQFEPAVAFDGSNFFVVWESQGDIFGARVTPAGTFLDGTGIPISTASGIQYQPAVAFDGRDYLVSWTDFTAAGTHIFGARVSRAGKVLDPNGLQISPAIGVQFDSAVTFAGGKFFVVWQDHRSGTAEIFGARISRSGSVLDDAGIRISADGGVQPAVASDGGNYLVVWTQVASDTNVLGARVSHAGKVVDPTGLPISTGPSFQSGPAVAFDGRTFLVVWNDFRSGITNGDIFGARLSRSGTVLDPTGIPISTAAGDQRRPAVAFGGTFLVVWEDRPPQVTQGAHIVGTTVGGGGIVQQPAGFPIAEAPFEDQFDPLAPAVAATTRDGTGVVYQRFAPEAPYGAVRVFLRTVLRQ